MILRNILFILLPLLVAIGIGVGVYVGWDAMQPSKDDPRGMPTRLYGRRVPGFRLPGLIEGGMTSVDLINNGKPVLLVYWSSWSAPSMQQHPVLLALQDAGVHIWGIAYRDKRNAVADFLERNSNPFERVANDEPGRTAQDFGIQGVPETFLIDGDGFVRWHMTGPITLDQATRQIVPLYLKFSG